LKQATKIPLRILRYTCTVAWTRLALVLTGFFSAFGNSATESVSKMKMQSVPGNAAGPLRAFLGL
jgi:hypothetical protein